jgi:hypothetical protein
MAGLLGFEIIIIKDCENDLSGLAHYTIFIVKVKNLKVHHFKQGDGKKRGEWVNDLCCSWFYTTSCGNRNAENR